MHFTGMMKDMNRSMKSKVDRLLELFPVVAIIGPRQCGKSTLSRQVRPDWKYFDLEKKSDYELIAGDPGLFFGNYAGQIILDEAQVAPELFTELRGVIDEKRGTKNRFLITGSSSPELLRHVSESLAGRIAIVELAPFSICELHKGEISPFYDLFGSRVTSRSPAKLKNLKPRYRHAEVMRMFFRGGYPEPLLMGKGDPDFPDHWFDGYVSTYVNRDVRRLFPRMDFPKYQRFMTSLSFLSGAIINKAELAGAIGVAESTIADYLRIAEGTFIWRNIPSFESNKFKSTVKSPKGYVRDSGLRHHLLKIRDLDLLLAHPQVGRSFEAFVIEELLKNIASLRIPKPDVFYFRTRNGAEIDLILEGKFGLLPIEIKLGGIQSRKKLTAMEQFLEKTRSPLGLVINNAPDVRRLSGKIVQIPAGCL